MIHAMIDPMQPPSAERTPTREELVETLLMAGRAMVALAARTLADVDDEVTLPQSRALIVLASRGPQRVTDIAADLGVAPSTATRMCDRLTRKGLIHRYRSAVNRREVLLSLTPSGKDLIRKLSQRRRDGLSLLVAPIPEESYIHIVQALQRFGSDAGELRERDWWFESADDEAEEAQEA